MTRISSLLFTGAALSACVDPSTPTTPTTATNDAFSTAYEGRPEMNGETRTGMFQIGDTVQELPYAVKGNLAFLDGDMVVPESVKTGEQNAFGIKTLAQAWPGGVIPYEIASTVDASYRTKIEEAMQEWEDKTVISFVPRTTQTDYVKISGDNTGCYSSVGHVGGVQGINLEGIDVAGESRCGYSAMLHELGHTIGLIHEQSRPDRNTFLEVHSENIVAEKAGNIGLVTSGLPIGSYDLSSLMHYGTFGFSATGNPVLVRRGAWGVLMMGTNSWQVLRNGQTAELSTSEILLGDLDGNGIADAIKANGNSISYMLNARGNWALRNERDAQLSELAVADWNGDQRDDLIQAAGGMMYVSYGGNSVFYTIAATPTPMSGLRFCDFDGDGKDDAFRATGSAWMMMRGGTTTWVTLQQRNELVAALRFAELDGDGKCDVYTSHFGRIDYSAGGTESWFHLPFNSALDDSNTDTHYELADVFHGDFDGDGVAELIKKVQVTPTEGEPYWQWQRALKAVGEDLPVIAKGAVPDASYLRIADMNGDGKDDVLMTGLHAPAGALTAGDLDAVNRMYSSSWQVAFSGSSAYQTLNITGYAMNQVAFGDFDGNGKSDALFADGTRWWVSWNSNTPFVVRNLATATLGQIRFGDFNGDGRTDAFRADGSGWYVSYSAVTGWQPLNNSAVTDLQIGDLNGDGRSDVFTAWSGKWFVCYGGAGNWTQIGSSSVTASQVRLYDFNGDGKDDVFHTTGEHWLVSYGGTSSWSTLNTSTYTLSALRFGDFDGNGRTDVFRADGTRWNISYNGAGGWSLLNMQSTTSLGLGDFDGNGRTDVVVVQPRLVK